MPSMTLRGAASTLPGPVTGHTSTHLPQRVHASVIASTRAASAVAKVSVICLPAAEYIALPPWPRKRMA